MARIIFADDDDSNRRSFIRIMKTYLEDCQIEAEIDEAVNGEELATRVIGGDYDLVFTDNRMPVLSGLEAIEKIRKAGKSTPIYIMSGDLDIEESAMKLGATGYIEKGDVNQTEKIRNTLIKYLAKR